MKKLYRKNFLFVLLAAGLLFSGCEQPAGGRPVSSAALQSLSISAGNLSPPFNAEITEYRAEVNNRVQEVLVEAVPSDPNASVSGTGRSSLIAGENTIAIGVRAGSGAVKNYTITVKRLDSSIVSIGSTDDLKKIGVEEAYSLAGDYTLEDSLLLEEWTPLATDADHAFSGSFDGAGHTLRIKSFAPDALDHTWLGIFGYVKGSGTVKAAIKDLAIVSEINQSSAPASRQAIGILTAYAENTDIDGITLEGSFTFTSTKTIYAGGIAGYIQTGTALKGCTVNASLNVAGGNGGTRLPGIQDEPYSYVGGVAGIFVNGGELINCHTTGDIKSFSDLDRSQVFCGGIAGGSYYGFTTAYQGKIEDCSSTGNIAAKSKGFWSWAGGIAGCIVGDGDGTPEKTTRIMRCFAGGTVSVADSGAGYPYAGGIVGYNYYGALVSQSYFTGTVIADKSGDYTGGIAGYNSKEPGHNSRIEDCWSSGTVTGFNNAGGIVGQNQVNTFVRRCYSIAAVEATNTGAIGVGGIAGMNASTETDAITGCVALNPSIKAGNTARIHRIAGSNSGTLTNNYAYSGMTVDPGSGTYTADKGADKVDGQDCAAQPDQSVYEELGWDFTSVWKMGADGYPALRWQN